MDLYQEAESIKSSLNISFVSALNLAYLRYRSRWTPDLEARLIAAAQAGITVTCDGAESKILSQLGF